MADKNDLDFSYSTIDEIFRLSIGETGDFSGARYEGNFTLSLEEAQRAKHKFIVDNLGINRNSRVLDLGCGWGPFLTYLKRNIGAEGIGLTLSERQARACRKNGLNVFIKDCTTVTPGDFGHFDALVSVGSFEHFCSLEEYQQGKQDAIYKDFFMNMAQLLPEGGKFYLQTMAFSDNMIDESAMDIHADKNSAAYLVALMVKEFPGSWLPYGLDTIIENASPYFKLVNYSSGRLDYIETISQWRKKFRKFNLKKYFLYLSMLPLYLVNKDFRHRVAVFRMSPNRMCFERQIMDHYRIVFEKV